MQSRAASWFVALCCWRRQGERTPPPWSCCAPTTTRLAAVVVVPLPPLHQGLLLPRSILWPPLTTESLVDPPFLAPLFTSSFIGLLVSSPPSVSHPFYSYPSHLISSVHQCWPLKVWYFDPLHDLPVQRLTRHSRNFHHVLDILPAVVVVDRVGPQDWLVFVLQSKVVQVLSTKCFTWVKFPICLNLPQKTRNFSAKLKIYFEQLSVFFTQIHFNSSL